MNSNRNRIKFLCVLILLLYIYSITVEEFIKSSSQNVGYPTPVKNGFKNKIKENRSSVVKINNKNYCRAPRVAILITSHQRRSLRLFWDIEFTRDGDWIGLYDEDPQTQPNTVPIFSAKVVNTTGILETNITHMPTNSSQLQYQSECSQFWAVYFTKSGTAAAVSCLKTHPTWMFNLRKYLGSTEIKQLFIPGTHDSGSFSTENKWSPFNLIEEFVFTQDDDIFSQLIHGIRYLDLRISSTQNAPEERWWINHGVARIQPLKNVLTDVKKFLRQTREIVILDFHDFPMGFSKEDSITHQELVDYLKSELSEWTAPPNWNATCNDLWNINKTLIVSYNHAKTVEENPSFLWTAVSHKWGNVQDVNKLKEYFTNTFTSHPNYCWAAMAELTPTLWIIMTYQTNGLREMADEVNPHVTSWFRGIWGKSSNIVAVDFYRGTDIVETAIEWNIRNTLRKIQKHICDIS